MNSLKEGTCDIPPHILTSVVHSSKDTNSDLYRFLNESFKSMIDAT